LRMGRLWESFAAITYIEHPFVFWKWGTGDADGEMVRACPIIASNARGRAVT